MEATAVFWTSWGCVLKTDISTVRVYKHGVYHLAFLVITPLTA